MPALPMPRFRVLGFRLLALSALFVSLLAGRAVAADGAATAPQVNIRAEMTAEPDPVQVGADIAYHYTVTNNGDAALTDVDVVDLDLGPIATVGSLNPGESKSWTRTETVGATTNTRRVMTVQATGPDGQEVDARKDVRFSIVAAETTTTAPPTTTTTVPPTTTTTTATTTTTTLPTQVLGVQVSRPTPELPRTGSPVKGKILAGLALVLLGLALRRRAAPA